MTSALASPPDRFGGFRAATALAAKSFVWAILAVLLFQTSVRAQIDPELRHLVQLGYNQPMEGGGPIAAYGFYYYNKPNFYSTNLTLRLAIAPIYLDSELGVSRLFGPNTDVAFGLAGGGFADTYSEIRQGNYRREESFTGHGGEASASIYHRFNPDARIPLWAIFRGGLHASTYQKDSATDPNFKAPGDRKTFQFRTGLRYGGREPSLTSPLAMELSGWYEGHFRTAPDTYGYNGDREINSDAHLFWGRALLKYTFAEERQFFDASLTLGASLHSDRFSCYRLGGVLPFASEFPLSIPGYYFQEISAERIALLNGQYSIAVDPNKNWRLIASGSTGPVKYLRGLEQEGHWHSGVGGGISYTSPRASWFVTLAYGHGFDSLRDGGRGSNQIGLLVQYDIDARRNNAARRFEPDISPYRSRGGERLFK